MSKKLFEIVMEIHCGEFEFYQTHLKVFNSIDEAHAHGLKMQSEENNGLTFDTKSNDGYYFELNSVKPVSSINGHDFIIYD